MIRLPSARSRPALVLLLALTTVLFGCDRRGGTVDHPTRRPTPGPQLLQGLGFSPFRDCQSPDRGVFPTLAQMKSDVDIIHRMGNAVRTYSSRNGMDEAAVYAKSVGLRVSAGAWLGPERTAQQRAANAAEIESVIALAKRIRLESVIVGNEVLLRGDLGADRLAGYIRQVKEAVGTEVPVTTAEIADVIVKPENRVVVDAVDLVTIHIYPYWTGVGIDGAAWYVADVFHTVKAKVGKPVVLGETGWPSAGPVHGSAVPSPENAARFLAEWHAVAADQHIGYYYFAAFDEPWKQEGGVGAHWGIMSVARRPKYAIAGLLDPPGPLPSRPAQPFPTTAGSTTAGTPQPSSTVFPIYVDWNAAATYVPSGWMGDVRNIKVNECWRDRPHSGDSAIRIAYLPQAHQPGAKGWAGIYWQFPENNWGNQSGGQDLRRYHAVTFYARGERGGERITFLSGGIAGRYGDTLRRHELAVTLSRGWHRYGIDLRDGDLRRVIGAFGWTAAQQENAAGAVFYLDDIQFDLSTPTPTANATRPCAVAGRRYILDGAHLCPSRSTAGKYEIGVDTSGGLRQWLSRQGEALRMDYPGGQDWGSVFVTVGDPVPEGQSRPGEDFSACRALQADLRSPSRTTTLRVGIKDSTMPDDGTETKVAVSVQDGWRTFSIPLRSFPDVDLTTVYVPIEFVFEAGSPPQQIYFRNVRYLCS